MKLIIPNESGRGGMIVSLMTKAKNTFIRHRTFVVIELPAAVEQTLELDDVI